MLLPALHHIPPLDHACCCGQSKNHIKTTINTTMAHTPQPALLQNDDHPLGRSYPQPPQFSLSEILVPHPNLIYITTSTNNNLLPPTHLPSTLHHGPSYPAAPTQPRRTTETADAGSRQNPELFRTKFPLSFIYLPTITHLIIQTSQPIQSLYTLRAVKTGCTFSRSERSSKSQPTTVQYALANTPYH